MYQRQAKAHEKLNQLNDACKVYLTIVVLHLAREDVVSAEQAFTDFMGR
jgi:hypothetical protein